jgi:hypothetical protein
VNVEVVGFLNSVNFYCAVWHKARRFYCEEGGSVFLRNDFQTSRGLSRLSLYRPQCPRTRSLRCGRLLLSTGFELRRPGLGAARHCCQGGCCWRCTLFLKRGQCWGAATVIASCSVLGFRLGKFLFCYPVVCGRLCKMCLSLGIAINAA